MSVVINALRAVVHADQKMPLVIRVMRVVTHVIQFISYASISLLALLTVVDVVRRFIFGVTMSGVTEYSQILLIISMTAMGYALVERRFIVVNEFVEKFPKWVNISMEIFMGAVSCAFFGIVGYMLIVRIESSIRFREAYFMIGVPEWPFIGILGLSFLACALATVVYVYERIVNYKDPEDRSFIDEPELSILGLTEEDITKDEGGAE